VDVCAVPGLALRAERSGLQFESTFVAGLKRLDGRQLVEVSRDDDLDAAKRHLSLTCRTTGLVQPSELVRFEHADLVDDEHVGRQDPVPTLLRHRHGPHFSNGLLHHSGIPPSVGEIGTAADVQRRYICRGHDVDTPMPGLQLFHIRPQHRRLARSRPASVKDVGTRPHELNDSQLLSAQPKGIRSWDGLCRTLHLDVVLRPVR